MPLTLHDLFLADAKEQIKKEAADRKAAKKAG